MKELKPITSLLSPLRRRCIELAEMGVGGMSPEMKKLTKSGRCFRHLFFCLLFIASCTFPKPGQNNSLLNLSHLDHLYQEVEIAGKPMAIVHIYADYPKYEWADASGEGTACVDDAARAAVFYLRHYRDAGQPASLGKARNLIEFILHMQARNGLFYNFVYADLTINTTRENSLPKADWWTWRAVWALGESYAYFKDVNPDYASKLKKSLAKVFPAIDSVLQSYPQFKENKGIRQPDWLPYGTASDQASELLLGLIPFYKTTHDSVLLRPIRLLCDGIVEMQAGDSASFPYGCILSWQNLWHAWGSGQPEALFRAGKVIGSDKFTEAASLPVEYFYPYLIGKGYLNQIQFAVENGKIKEATSQTFPQIAYDVRPMVMGSLAAYQFSGDQKYAKQAAEIACWLLGKNVADKALYNPETGRCFDGIESTTKINENSGAESTIEALLTLQAIEKYSIAQEAVKKYYDEKNGNSH